MIDIETITIPALTGDEERRAFIYYPDWLEDNPEMRLPVLYMFDGHNLFLDEEATYGKSWGLAEFLEKEDVPLIVAAPECNHDAKGGRLKEYSPYSGNMPGFGKLQGLGKTTMDWMVGDFKPWVDKTYPTLPDRAHTFLGGSSMGGLMTLYGITRYNQVFSRGAALSPSIWFEREKLANMVQKARIRRDTVLYMDYGQQEMEGREMADWFGQVCAMLMAKRVNLTARIVPGGRHCEESWEKQIPFFMHTLFYELEEAF